MVFDMEILTTRAQVVPGLEPGSPATRWWIVALCCAIMMVEGFDLLIYSNAIPALLADAAMGMDKALAGQVGSMVFVGMLLGGVCAGRLNQALGQRRVIALGFIGFTLTTALAAWAGNAWQLGALRLLAGLGLGVVLPAALALARAHSLPQHSALTISIVMSGIALGGMAASLAAMPIVAHWGWRPLFLAGGALGLLVLLALVPLLARAERLQPTPQAGAAPQSAQQPAQPSAPQPAQAQAQSWRRILGGASLAVLALGTLATLADLLTWYGITVWLTQLMREFDMPFNGALQMMFTLNIGAILGSLGTASLAMRLGTRPVAMAAGALAALCLLAIASRQFSGQALLIIVALLGMSAISAQNLVNALVSDAFPVAYRAAAIGMTLGLGRLGAVIAPSLGGHILAAGHGPERVLQAFALAAGLGVLVLVFFTPALSQRSVARLQSPEGH
ncbi:MFS transporter [Vandammella animalimorsus]|uniref:MFS transporter n=2 Tax=Vandammella animalimorsus TaxID=2029117 RepID=A0A2A2AKD6_9BURK|nr:MFS transporter [Vandammella animalimorsus]